MHRIAGVLVAASLSLSGCASVPLATARQLASQSPQSLAALDPAQLQVRVAMPRDFALDVPASLLSLSLDGPSGLRSESFTLRLLGVAPETRSGDWLARKVAVSSYLLALSPESARKLRELQNLAGAASTTFRQFRVQARLAKQPPQPRDLQIWVDVKLDSSQGFVPLIDGAKLPYDDKLG